MPPSGRRPSGDVVREIGHVTDANGSQVTVAVDCDGVEIRVQGGKAMLGPAERDAFTRLYFDAERAADEWTKTYAPGELAAP